MSIATAPASRRMTSSQQLIDDLGLERIFEDGRLNFDLEQGTVRSFTSERVLYLSSDVLRGVYDALRDEAGPAWAIILKNCGRIWGRRLMQSFDEELKASGLQAQGEATVGKFLHFTEAYFPLHGWGHLHLNLDHAASSGVVTAELRHSLFVSLIEEETQPVDSMIAGMLASFFSHVSGQELDCLELTCRGVGAEACRFAITAPERLEALEGRVEAREAYDTLLRDLLA